MSLYLYAFKKASVNSQNEIIYDLSNKEVVEISYKDVALVGEYIEEDSRELTITHSLLHEKVVEELWEFATILPLQFGVVFKNKDKAIKLLSSHARELRKRIEELEGLKELGVKIFWTPPKKNNELQDASIKKSETSPQEFMKQLKKKYTADSSVENKAREINNKLHEMFLKVAERGKFQTLRTESLLFDGAYLIEGKGISSFGEQAKKAEDEIENLKITVTGPWPPYSFCNLDLTNFEI